MSNNIPENFDQNQVPTNYDPRDTQQPVGGSIDGNPYAYQEPTEQSINRANAIAVAESKKWYNRKGTWAGFAFASAMILGISIGSGENKEVNAVKEFVSEPTTAATKKVEPEKKTDAATSKSVNEQAFLLTMKSMHGDVVQYSTDEQLLQIGYDLCTAMNTVSIKTLGEQLIEEGVDLDLGGGFIGAAANTLCKEHKSKVDAFVAAYVD